MQFLSSKTLERMKNTIALLQKLVSEQIDSKSRREASIRNSCQFYQKKNESATKAILDESESKKQKRAMLKKFKNCRQILRLIKLKIAMLKRDSKNAD